MRYKLSCPGCTNPIHIRNGKSDGPIYYCPSCTRLWALSISKDHGLKSVLKEYDPKTGKSSDEVAAVVPDDWEGDPAEINIGPEEWQAVQNPKLADSAADLAGGIMDSIRQGDSVFLQDYYGQRTHRVLIKNDKLDPQKI